MDWPRHNVSIVSQGVLLHCGALAFRVTSGTFGALTRPWGRQPKSALILALAALALVALLALRAGRIWG